MGTNQFALGESGRRVCTHTQLGEEQEGKDGYLHGEDVFVVSMMAGRSCLCRVEISGRLIRGVAVERIIGFRFVLQRIVMLLLSWPQNGK